MSSTHRILPFVPCCFVLLTVLALAACGATSASGTPTSDTASWQTYLGPHFSLSFAPDWKVKTLPLKASNAAQSATGYAFYSPDGKQEVAVIEEDGVTTATVHNVCNATGTRVTVAGLSMRYALAPNGVRSFTFVSTKNIVYTLVSEGPGNQPQNQGLYNSVMATFKPDAAGSAC